MKIILISLTISLLMSNCNAQHKTEDIQIMKDEYTENWEGKTLHIYFKGNTAYVKPGEKSIEPEYYEESLNFTKWYRDYHYYQYFAPSVSLSQIQDRNIFQQ